MANTSPSPQGSPQTAQRSAIAVIRASRIKRFMLFIACLALGIVIGVIGEHITSQPEWYLAVPLCIAIGWLFVGTPDECAGPHCPVRKNDAT